MCVKEKRLPLVADSLSIVVITFRKDMTQDYNVRSRCFSEWCELKCLFLPKFSDYIIVIMSLKGHP